MSSERIQALETQQINDDRAREEDRARLMNIENDVQEIKLVLRGQKGYIAGAMSVVVVIWTVVLSAVMVLWDRVVDSVAGMFP